MVNHSTNIIKTNNDLSSQVVEHKKTTSCGIGNSVSGYGRAQKCSEVKPVNGSQLSHSDNWISIYNTNKR